MHIATQCYGNIMAGNQEARIKLAEAMGAKQGKEHGGYVWIHVPNHGKTQPTSTKDWIPFDPYTNAADDYAVLEHMRHSDKWHDCVLAMYMYIFEYHVGDFADVYLGILNND